MTIQEAIKAIKAHRGPVMVDARITAHDMVWVEAKKGSLLETLKELRSEGDTGDYDFDVVGSTGYFSADA